MVTAPRLNTVMPEVNLKKSTGKNANRMTVLRIRHVSTWVLVLVTFRYAIICIDNSTETCYISMLTFPTSV